jgi:isoquinoline 1-oxidoreductase beta subunit
VRTLWSREDDIKGGYYRPMHVHRAEIGFDAQGNILAWDHVIVGQSITKGTPFESFMIKNGIDNHGVEGMKEPYDVPMRLSVHHPRSTCRCLWWRSVGSTHTAYVMETLLDEMARATQQDPVAYRLRLMGDKHPRHKAALHVAVEQSGYGKKQAAQGRAWGVAVHESFDSVVAYVVEASVTKGTPKLHSRHGGRALQPGRQPQERGSPGAGRRADGPGHVPARRRHHAEGRRGGAKQLRRLCRGPHHRHARITVHIVPSAEPPTGMGEPGLPPLAPAFANAIAKLTGKTPREPGLLFTTPTNRETGRQSVLRRSRRSPRSGRGQLMWGSRTLCRPGSQRKPTRCRRC